jgi:ABC-2 type transport system permease protein
MPIFDQGYQHWHGSLSGPGWRWLTVARHGVRAGLQNRWLRIVLLFAWFPALILASFLCLWGMAERRTPWAVGLLAAFVPSRELLTDPSAFRLPLWALAFQKFLESEIYFVVILVLMVGPALISQDLRFNALPLYFSRPVRRIDYFLGKLGVIAFFLGLVTVVPAVAAWFLGVLFSLDFTVAVATVPVLVGVVVYGLVVALSAGLLMLAMSSLSRNSRYVGAFWAGFWLFTLILSSILVGVHQSAYYLALREARFQGDRQGEARLREEFESAFRNDWRPMVSYTANLLRIGDALLGADAARDRFEALLEDLRAGHGGPPANDVRFRAPPASRWPWYWSALVLLALGGVSAWILNTRVRTLDRLR